MTSDPSFSIYQYTTKPDMLIQLQRNGVNLNIGALATVKLYAKKQGATVLSIDGEAMTVLDPVNGTISFTFTAAQTAVMGTYSAQVEITYGVNLLERTAQFSYAVLPSV
jgi:hypothetical protein